MEVERAYGIYHADGGILGELSYVWGKIRGTAHCALCDITHKGVSMKKEWREMSDNLDFDIELLHLNEQFPELEKITLGRTPCVVVSYGENLEIIVDADDLEECEKSVNSFRETLESALGSALTE
tara:strand:- start:84 stop:458 length:375 start_codon:yes stop_codon:yes gene_type:complete